MAVMYDSIVQNEFKTKPECKQVCSKWFRFRKDIRKNSRVKESEEEVTGRSGTCCIKG